MASARRRRVRCAKCGAAVRVGTAAEFECPACEATAVRVGPSARRRGVRRVRDFDWSAFRIDRRGDRLRVSWPWDRFKGGVAIFAAVFLWNFEQGGPRDGLAVLTEWVTSAVASVFSLIAPIFLLNRTELTFDANGLSHRHRPFIGLRTTPVETASVRTFRVKERFRGKETRFDVVAIREGPDRRVARFSQGREAEANALARILNEHLRFLGEGPREDGAAGPFATLSCPHCGRSMPVPGGTDRRPCPSCGETVRVPEAVRDSLGLRRPVTLDRLVSRSVTAERIGDDLLVTVRWDRRLAGVLAKRAVVSFAIAAAASAGLTALFRGRGEPIGFQVVMAIAFVGLPSLAGGAFAWMAAGHRFNRTLIHASRRTLTARHEPLPRLVRGSLVSEEVAQIAVVEASDWDRGRTRCAYWSLVAVSPDGASLDLVADTRDRDALLVVERLLEDRLGIEDRHVADA